MAFQFCLWDVFRRLEEQNDGLDELNSQLDMRGIVNIAKLYGNLVADGKLTILLLKVIHHLRGLPIGANRATRS